MAGPWEKYANPATRYGADPTKVRQEQRAEEDQMMQREAAARAAQAAERAAANSEAANALARERFEFEKSKGTKAPLTAKERADAVAAFNSASSIDRLVAQMEQQFRAGPGATTGISGALDYLPFTENQQFDRTGNSVRGHVGTALGFTGGQLNSVAEAEMAVGPYLPASGDRDAVILDKIQRLKDLANDARTRSTAILGGVPDQYGNIGPVEEVAQAAQSALAQPTQGRDTTPALLGGNSGGPDFGNPAPDPSGFVPYGSTMRRENNPQWKGVNEAVKGMIVAGQSPDQISAYLQQQGISTDALSGVGQAIDYYRRTGKKDFRVNVDDIEVPMSGVEQFRNNAPQTRLGTAAATALNAGGFGIPQALAGDQLQYLRDQNPVSAFAGDVTGIVGATSALGKAGGSLAGKLTPSLLTGGGKAGNVARAVAPDAAYGAIYGGVTEGDPLTGAATATIGSGAGQLLGKGLQKTFTGVTDPAVQYLTQRGIPLSLGETLGNNSIIGRQMQRMESIPVLGDLMSARRGEARDAVYRATLEDAVAPVGGRIDAADPLASAQSAIGNAYENAVGDVTVPLDSRFFDELGAARNSASTLPPDLQGKFNAAMASRVDPLSSSVSILPQPSQLNKPRVPTASEMANLSRIEDVPLSAARAGQSQMAWAEQNAKKFADPLIDGFADRPVAIRLENGEYIIADGNHRAVRAFNEGRQTLPSYVIDAKAFDPANAGRRPINSNQSSDDIFSELQAAGFDLNAAQPAAAQTGPNLSALTGQQYQQAMRGLSGYKSEATKPGFEQDYRDAISMVQDALKGQMMRSGGDTVVTGLRNADAAYSMLKPIEAATISARGTPTPKQLLGAFTNNTKKYGGTAAAARGDKVPEVVRLAANNAPNIGNSGTADRLAGIMPFLLPTALGGSAVGLETFTDSPFLTGSLATLAALSTRTGQKATQAALTKRPKALRRVGGLFGRRETQKGLAGMVTAPLLIEN